MSYTDKNKYLCVGFLCQEKEKREAAEDEVGPQKTFTEYFIHCIVIVLFVTIRVDCKSVPKFCHCNLVCNQVLSRKKVTDQVCDQLAVMEFGH